MEEDAEDGAADLDTQLSDIMMLLKSKLLKGYIWYLVDSHWFKQRKKYVGFDSWDKCQMGDQNIYAGPIDNSGLLKDGNAQSLKEHLIDELNYILLPTEGWNKLVTLSFEYNQIMILHNTSLVLHKEVQISYLPSEPFHLINLSIDYSERIFLVYP
uniref:ubiquitinyl hydrolase 1 n=1 Tax=Peromyscus maniculatus bairdii TaxID=230844 RepID=A0A8C8T025_PERMB